MFKGATVVNQRRALYLTCRRLFWPRRSSAGEAKSQRPPTRRRTPMPLGMAAEPPPDRLTVLNPLAETAAELFVLVTLWH